MCQCVFACGESCSRGAKGAQLHVGRTWGCSTKLLISQSGLNKDAKLCGRQVRLCKAVPTPHTVLAQASAEA